MKISSLKFAMLLIVSTLGISACLPKRAGSGADSSSTSAPVENLFSVNSVKTSSSNIAPNVDPVGRYYSTDPLYTVSGVCRGDVQKVLVQLTPQSQTTTEEVVNCSNNAYTWTKTFPSENSYAVRLIALNSNSVTVAGMAQALKTLVYDITAPATPTFLTPTTASSYLLTDGSTQLTVTGQVLKDTDILLGPTNLPVTLSPNADNIHLDYSYTVSIPNNTAVNASFKALDYAGNSAVNTMSIQSMIGIKIPIAANELGGSAEFNGVYIQSTISLYPDVVVNDYLGIKNGSTSILGDMQ